MPRESIIIRDPRKPGIPRDIKVTLSQFNSVSSLTNNWRLTPSEIIRVINRNECHFKLTREELLKGLSAACAEGCLENDGGTYQLTSKGIDVTGVEDKSEPDRYGAAGICRARYSALPR